MNATCHNCGRPALYQLGDDAGNQISLCIDCNLKHEHAMALEFDRHARAFNRIADSMAGWGVPIAKFAPRQQPIVHSGDVVLNNINIEGSTIGVLNTGNIQTVDFAVTLLKRSGEQETADIFQKLTEEIINSVDLDAAMKNTATELLGMLSTEATAPVEKRRSGAMRTLLAELSGIVGGVASLSQLWQQYSPSLFSLFG